MSAFIPGFRRVGSKYGDTAHRDIFGIQDGTVNQGRSPASKAWSDDNHGADVLLLEKVSDLIGGVHADRFYYPDRYAFNLWQPGNPCHERRSTGFHVVRLLAFVCRQRHKYPRG